MVKAEFIQLARSKPFCFGFDAFVSSLDVDGATIFGYNKPATPIGKGI